ncbi:DUF1616 domain-containing protein [Methanosarcina sp. KYL-1]|uniref:DUF1616 domain-containing protein n=1 Tax=Methanosarcina sp. KYL-1 TaxID=2602068 RepID=UPI0021014C46|nr:DUF1616 domain-containing protein [Methanosarcina sp. KYL-1]MCQ1535502.1 DUF1616 domain-containing protein [Methanosarcina sp. KYL-1]
MPNFKKCIFVEDLLAVTFLSCLGVVFVLVPPFNETFLRIPIALSLFFFVPGYTFIAALFPGNKEISGIERFTLSVGFSLVLTVFDGFLISLLPWRYRPAPIVVSILGMTVFFCIIAFFTRKHLDESEQFSFSVKEFIRSIQSDDLAETDETDEAVEVSSDSTETRRFHRSRSKVKAKGLKHKPGPKVGQIPLPPEIEKALVIALVGSIIIASGMLAYAKITREKETFSMLYLLGPDGKAEGYPSESFINIPITVTVGIDNHELQDVNYILQMKIDGGVIEELNIPLKEGGSWQKDLTYTRYELKNSRSKLEFALFKDEISYFPYRTVHLYIQNNNSFTHLGDDYGDISKLPKIKNGDMDFASGWAFTSNTENITGSYVNDSGLNSSAAYRMVNSYEGLLPMYTVEYGELSQRLECEEETLAVISASVKDNFSSKSQAQGDSQFKQIAVDGKVFWEDSVSGDEGWQRIEVPVSLKAGKNNLTLRLLQRGSSELVPLEVLWDNISLKPIRELSPYLEEGSLVENIPPVSKVLELQPYSSKESFTVRWNGTDEGSGIAYYSISYSVDGTTWKPWIEKTNLTSSIFSGVNNRTYYFRSKAVDKAGNVEPEHETPDTMTAVYTELPKIELDITPNPCKGSAWFTVTSSVSLEDQFCLVGLENMDPEVVKMTSSDGLIWRGSYVARHNGIYYVEAVCTDVFGTTTSTFDELLVENSLANFEIEVNPEIIDRGTIEIKVTPSTALKRQPYVSISANEDIDVTYLTYSEDGEYIYTAKITRAIDEGTHKVSVTGYTLDSEKLEGSSSFVVEHAD